MDEYIGYEKHGPSDKNTGHRSNWTSSKTQKRNISDIPLNVSRDRETSFLATNIRFTDPVNTDFSERQSTPAPYIICIDIFSCNLPS
jgi:hypothetical protein